MRFIFVLAFPFLTAALARPADDTTQEDLLKLEKQLKDAHAKGGSSVACVVVSRSDKYPKPAKAPEPWQLGGFDRDAFLKTGPTKAKLAKQLDLAKPESILDHSFAGGVVIDASGLVLTSYGTIEGATKVFVHLPGGTGSYADIRAADKRSDLAVLKLLAPPDDLKPIRFGRVRLPDFANDPKATAFPGKIALLMAYPFATPAAMVRANAGLATVMNVRVPISVVDPFPNFNPRRGGGSLFSSIYNYAPVLDYESRFAPGVSGAVLLNLDGEAIALTAPTAAIPTADSGRNYALPLDDNVLRIVEVLRRGEEVEYGFLGITQQPPNARGIPVGDGLTRGSPAQIAGLTPFDLITRINDRPVNAFEHLLLHVGSGLAGGKIALRVEQGVRSRDVDVVLAKFKNSEPFIASVRPEAVFGLRVDYSSVLVQTLIVNFFGGPRIVPEIPSGVFVSELLPDSPAAAKFKALGENTRWVITHVNGKPTLTPPEFYQEAKGQKSLKLTVVDPSEGVGRSREVALP